MDFHPVSPNPKMQTNVICQTFMHLTLEKNLKIEEIFLFLRIWIMQTHIPSKFVEQIFCQIVGCSKCIFAAVTPNFLARFPNWHSHFAEFHACLDSTTISGASSYTGCL